MKTKIEVIGGTDKTVRSAIYINDEKAGELQVARDDFTRFCGLIFGGTYTISESMPELKIAP